MLQGSLPFRVCPAGRGVEPREESWGVAGICSLLPVAGVLDPLWVSMEVVLKGGSYDSLWAYPKPDPF